MATVQRPKEVKFTPQPLSTPSFSYWQKPECPDHGRRYMRRGWGTNGSGQWFKCRLVGCNYKTWVPGNGSE